MSTNGKDELDLIWGVSAIARLIGRTDRQAFYMLSSGQLPGRKIGGRWVIARSQLIAAFVGNAA